MSHSSENGTGFRPIRRGQVIDEIEEVESEQAESSSTAFTRRKVEQTSKSSIFPSWDLLPPKTIIRRKGQL